LSVPENLLGFFHYLSTQIFSGLCRRRRPLNHEAHDAAHFRRMLRSLLHLNEVLLDRFKRIVAETTAGETLSPKDRDVLSTIYKHSLMVGDFEKQLVKRGLLDAAGPGEALDLDAARGEVAGRLARLQNVRQQRGAA
jgi:hypothetical protein